MLLAEQMLASEEGFASVELFQKTRSRISHIQQQFSREIFGLDVFLLVIILRTDIRHEEQLCVVTNSAESFTLCCTFSSLTHVRVGPAGHLASA